MRTLILVFVCLGIGYGIAVSQFQKRTVDIENVMGTRRDMEAAISDAKASDAKPGKIEVVGGTELDFGTMRLGTKRSHSFIFRNVGGTPVEVVYKTSSCKCTVGKKDSKTLKPDEQTTIDLEWLAEGNLADFAQTATIATTAVDQEEIKLTISGKIGQAYVFDPPIVDFREFQASEEHEKKGRLYSFEESPLEVTETHWSDKVLSQKINCTLGEYKKLEKDEIPAYADARHYVDFTIQLSKGIPAGSISGNMVFVKNADKEDAKTDQVELPVNGKSVSPIQVIAGPDFNEDRNIFTLGTAKSSVGLKKSFVVRVRTEGNSNVEVKLGDVTPTAAKEALRVSINEVKTTSTKLKMFSVTVEIPAGGPTVEFGGAFGKDFAKIVLETNMESAPQFPMYIKFRILE
jgi:ribosomal protein S9